MLGAWCLLFGAIELTGVTGNALRARAFFDANNVKVGDPMILTVDFIGEAEFKDLHPPALAKIVSRKDWKLDDVSAKTDTFRDARRLTYRIRPMREGVLWFPVLEFEYAGSDGRKRIVRSNEIPVHAKGGVQVVVEEMGEDHNAMPQPPALMDMCALTGDERFRWRKAMAKPTADAFAEFDFAEAKMNEATCAIREGNWARALKIYQKLEWTTGQTPEMERGIIAALALRYENPAVELPIWRQVLRPLLRYGWIWRVAIVIGGFGLLALVFWLLGRGIRALACLALVLLVVRTASAETTETVTTNADGSVVVRRVTTGGNGNFSFSFSSSSSSGGVAPRSMRSSFFGGQDPFEMMENFDPFGSRRVRANRPKVVIDARLEADRPDVTVGEDFNLILTLDVPRYVAFSEGVRLTLSETTRLVQTGNGQALRNAASQNPTNVLQRLVFPMRANEPFTNLSFSVEGDYVFVNDRSFFRSSYPYSSGGRRAALVVKPFPSEGRPADFGGIVSEGVLIRESCDLQQVETNDVVTITYLLCPNGYVPDGYLPTGAAFEWTRKQDRAGKLAEIEYRRYFVADGAAKTPELVVPYYNPRTKKYQSTKVGGTPLKYGIMR